MQKALCILAVLAMMLGGCGAEWFPDTVRSPTTPDSFFFTSVTEQTPESTATSNTITITGIQSGSAPISITGDPSSKYKINDGTFTADAGTVNNNDKVAVQHTAASGVAQTVTSTLKIGDKSASFSSTTANIKSFDLTKSAAAGTTVVSDPIPLTLVPGTYTINILNGKYSFDGFNFVTIEQTLYLNNNQTLYVQNVVPSKSVLTIGGVLCTFTSVVQ